MEGCQIMNRPTKNCVVCGREIQWRKKWRDNWHQGKYCSRSRKTGASICPGEAAREAAPGDDENLWRPLLERARRAARRLAHRGKIEILQGGSRVEPSRFKGPVRLRRLQ